MPHDGGWIYMNNRRDGGSGREKTLFAMSSITYAIKAQTILRENGFGCEVVRTPKDLASGCGYSVRVTGSSERATALLQRYGIQIKASRRL